MLTAPSVSRFFSSLQAYFNHMEERERKEKIIALSRVKLVDCDDTFSFFFFFFLFFKIADLVYHRRDWSKQKRGGGRKRTINGARSGKNDASIILSFFRIVNCNSPQRSDGIQWKYTRCLFP